PRHRHSFPTRRSSDLAGLLCDDTAAVAIYLERHDRVGEPFAVVIEEQQRVEESVAELVMQRLIGVGDVEPAFDHAAGDELPGIRSEEHTSELQSLAYL